MRSRSSSTPAAMNSSTAATVSRNRSRVSEVLNRASFFGQSEMNRFFDYFDPKDSRTSVNAFVFLGMTTLLLKMMRACLMTAVFLLKVCKSLLRFSVCDNVVICVFFVTGNQVNAMLSDKSHMQMSDHVRVGNVKARSVMLGPKISDSTVPVVPSPHKVETIIEKDRKIKRRFFLQSLVNFTVISNYFVF